MTASADPQRTAPRLAFGVDPSRPERYSLRQARYAALADDIGVPIFPPPLHLVRKHLVPLLPSSLRPEDSTHQQAFSLASFRRELQKQPLTVEAVRGFRIVSGGLLRPLENYRWWWRFNRRLGELVPALCIEAQIIARKAT